MPKHLFFDLDNTLTRSRSRMTPAHAELFEQLCKRCDVVVITGQRESQIREQITVPSGNYYLLSQQGNMAVAPNGQLLWEELLTPQQEVAALGFIDSLKRYFNINVKDESDLIENRGSQIAYSVLGFHEDIDKKYAFDPSGEKRKAALEAHQREVQELRSIGVDIMPAGTTTYDIILLGKHKGYNVQRLLVHEGWQRDDCLYIGDELQPGRNDESVIGIIPTHAVNGPAETFDFIKRMVS